MNPRCPRSPEAARLRSLDICMQMIMIVGFSFFCFMAFAGCGFGFGIGGVLAENDNLSMSSVANTETIKIGNTKTNNYNIHGSNFLPTQLTQVVLNVPKIGKKLRRTRQPTVEEMAIKGKILEIYDRAREEIESSSSQPPLSSVHFEHLGRVIRALNPKYIATERVRRVVFADPRDPNSLIPLPDYRPTPMPTPQEGGVALELIQTEGSPLDKLNLLSSKFNELFSWDENIVEQFASLPDESLESSQAAIKQVILCLSGHPMCAQPAGFPFQPLVAEEQQQPVVAQFSPYELQRQPQVMMASPSSANEAYMTRPPAQQPNAYQMPPNVRPRPQIPEEVKQRFYMRQAQAGPGAHRRGPPMNSRSDRRG